MPDPQQDPVQSELKQQENQAAPQAAEPQSAEQPASEPQPAEQQLAETLSNLEEMLKKAEQAALQHHDAWLRARAEADNIRKRAQLDIANAHKYALETFSTELLTVKDSLETSLTVENASVEQLKSGVELTLKLLSQVFEKFNIKEINPAAGDKFDPHQHQAMTSVESSAPPNTVVHVMQKGYRLHDRVIRPALVTVSKANDA